MASTLSTMIVIKTMGALKNNNGFEIAKKVKFK